MKTKLANRRSALLFVLAGLAVGQSARSADMIYVHSGGKETLSFGRISMMTATAVTLDSSNERKSGPSEIATNEITRIQFEGSPEALQTAQKKILDGDFDGALESLDKEGIDDGHRREITEELAFDRALCAAQIALAGRGEPHPAALKMLRFLQNTPNSFHYYQACGLLGDLLVADGKMKAAQDYYAKLAQAPWPDYKMKAQIALGHAYLAMNDVAQADKSFDDAISSEASGELAESQRALATIGKARCQILSGKVDQAMRTADLMLARTDEKNAELQASSYNAIGAALRKKDDPKKAILAFLHTHLMFSNVLDADAEAVANLEQLFIQTHNASHAQEMRQILDERYKNSRWAKMNK